MKPVGLANTRISTAYARKSPRSLIQSHDLVNYSLDFFLCIRVF